MERYKSCWNLVYVGVFKKTILFGFFFFLSEIKPCQLFSSQNPLHQPRGVCQSKEAAQQLRSELNSGSLKRTRDGEEVRGA